MPDLKPLRPMFTYFGAKWRMAKLYALPRHDLIIEPFAGAAGYSLHHYSRQVVLCDMDPAIVGTWEYLISASPEEITRLPVYDGTWTNVSELKIPEEAKLLIGWWLKTASNKPYEFAAGRVRDENWRDNAPSKFWSPAIRERVTQQVAQIKHWRVVQSSYENLPDVDATWFVDPPYQVAGKHYVHSDIDFPALGEWCRTRTGQVQVCENVGADWLPFTLLKSAASQGTRRSLEAIWTPELEDVL